jgi:hypothetical protein
MVLQMEIDGLGYCHGAPPVVGVVGGKRHEGNIYPGGSSRQEGGLILMDKLFSQNPFLSLGILKGRTSSIQ